MHELSIHSSNIILEPVGRNTAPALAIAALKAQENGDDPVLLVLAADHTIIQNVLDYRGLAKLKSTYVDALPEQVEEDGRVHTDYMQTVAATGRLSSNNPNLQNIPIRTERGRQVRKAFVPKNEDYVLLAADYSQIELRIIAALSEEDTMF